MSCTRAHVQDEAHIDATHLSTIIQVSPSSAGKLYQMCTQNMYMTHQRQGARTFSVVSTFGPSVD